MIEFEIRQLERHSSEAYAADALCTAVIRGEPGRGPYRMRPDPDEELYAAFVENEMQGMAQVYQDPANRTSLYIARLAVKLQRNRIGTGLVAHIANCAMDQGYTRLSTLPITEEGEKFFASQGFEHQDPAGYSKRMFRGLSVGD